MTGRRRLVRSTGILADQKAEREALADLIDATTKQRTTPELRVYISPQLAPALAQRIIESDVWRNRRVVVDDAMIKRAARVLNLVHDDTIRAALVEALGNDEARIAAAFTQDTP